MIVKDEDLDELVGKGPDFEKMVHGLIRAESWACGIKPDQIDWDNRTNVPDGGRDVLIREGNQRTDRPLLPSVKSLWSLKSGTDGLSPATLRKEINNHPEVISHLQAGGVYVWCMVAAASHDKREKLRRAVDPLATKYNFAPMQVRFLFRDAITQWLNQHIGLIPVYLPKLPRGWKSRREWRRLDRNRKVPWVKFGNREKLARAIRGYLLSKSGNNVIHLVGWSGIGKTRTVRRACQHDLLEGVLYFPRLEAFTSDFEDHLTRNEGIRAAIVIDEVEIDEFVALQTRLSDFRDRIRIVTIGAGTTKSAMFRQGVISVSLPDSATDVTQVIRADDSSLSAMQAQDIADWCDHDLRLALLLTAANKLDPGLANRPITSVDDVWSRVMTLFESEIGNLSDFRDFYIIMSMCQDLGNLGEKRGELKYLSSYFEKSTAGLDRAIDQARNIGLGRQQGRFFEAAPRALARRVFERWGWGWIKNDALQFIYGLPTERLRRRFIDRIQECDQSTRDEAVQILRKWWHSRFPEADLALIADQEPARVFAEYTETDPPGGLRWLKEAVAGASPEQLLAFVGGVDINGGWRGRRYIVWLCERLARFPEYVWDSEIILFRLGQYETELNVGNNSLRTWKNLFLPFLSNTSLPFNIRWQRLMKRLAEAAEQQLPLIMDAAMGALLQSVRFATVGEGASQSVGGKLAPPMWRPASRADLYKMTSAAAMEIIGHIKEMPSDQQNIYKEDVIKYIDVFVKLGTLEILRGWLTPKNIGDEELRQLRHHLDTYINGLNLQVKGVSKSGRRRSDNQKELVRRELEYVLPWRRSFDPQNLDERIKDVTGRDSWDQPGNDVMDPLVVNKIYEELAREILSTPLALSGVWDWFTSEIPRSAFELGLALGKLDLDAEFEKDLLAQLAQGRCMRLVAGYFDGLNQRLGAVSTSLTDVLDAMVDDYPDAAMLVTIRADISESGFRRLLRLAPQTKPGAYSLLDELRIRQAWRQLMSVERQALIMDLLAQIGKAGQPYAYDLALRMAVKLTPEGEMFSVSLADAVLPILTDWLERPQLSNREKSWMDAVGKLPDARLSPRIDLLAKAVKVDASLRSDALAMLGDIFRSYQDQAIKILEAIISSLDTQEDPSLGYLLGVFDDNHLEALQQLIGRLGIDGARALASHLRPPSPTRDNPLYVPAITAWFLKEFENDDEMFDLFLHGFYRVRVGAHSPYIGTEERVSPYLYHPLRRVREWAQDEINYAKDNLEGFKLIDLERDRT